MNPSGTGSESTDRFDHNQQNLKKVELVLIGIHGRIKELRNKAALNTMENVELDNLLKAEQQLNAKIETIRDE